MDNYNIFVSHGSADMWLAGQIEKETKSLGASPFLDNAHIPKGSPDFKRIIRDKIEESQELIALFTPWSAKRSWVWVEIGAAWSQEIPVLAVFYGMDVDDLDKSGQGKAVLEDINVIKLDDFTGYLGELQLRVRKAQE